MEVSESAFEYLLGELMELKDPKADESDQGYNRIAQRLDEMGFSVGYRLIEKISSQQKLIGKEPLDIVKYICKEFWEFTFKKKVDKLQTNHKGVFVLSDLKFKWVEKYASEDIASMQAAVNLLNFPCGMIRGALYNLGLPATVLAEFNTLPSCTFSIRVKT